MMNSSTIIISLLWFIITIRFYALAIEVDNAETDNSNYVIDLYPEQVYKVNQFPCKTNLQLYHIHNLLPSKTYDVKISYPASHPMSFHLDIHQWLPVSTSHRRVHRNLLNTAKLRLNPKLASLSNDVLYTLGAMHYTTENIPISVQISIQIALEGVPYSPMQMNERECVYDIIVEEILANAFPYSTIILIIWILLLLLVTRRYFFHLITQKLALERPEDQVRNHNENKAA